jgi:hypothetical protein
MEYENLYKTPDFCLSVTLVILGFEIVSLEKITPTQYAFCFKTSDDLQNTIQDYWLQKVRVKPQDYFLTQKKLKSMLFSGGVYAS